MKFTQQSIVKLIRACKENGIAELECGDLYLRLDQAARPVEARLPPAIAVENSQEIKKLTLVDDEVGEEAKAVLDDDAELLISDPEEFETQLARGELSEEMHNR